MGTGRNLPPFLVKLLKVDVELSDKFCVFMERFTPIKSLEMHHKALELTNHGILWLAGWMIFIWVAHYQNLYELQVNFFIGLILDIIAVALIKSYVRRRRPAGNKSQMIGTFGPDKYSFPSGHASRAVYIATFLIFVYPISIIFYPPILAWTVSMCFSRVLMRRHHILDVIAGIFLGFIEALFIYLIWLGPGMCTFLLSFISDQKTEFE